MSRRSIKLHKSKAHSDRIVARAARRNLFASRNYALVRTIPQSVSAAQGGQSAVANRQHVTLRYSEIIPVTGAAAGVGVINSFRANSIYDPNFTGVGHQPMGHDEWSSFYQHYQVKGARIKAQLANQEQTGGEPVVFWVELASTSTATLNPNTAIERGRAAWKCVGQQTDTLAAPLNNEYDATKFFGKAMANQTTQVALFGSNPGEDVFFHVGYAPMSSLATPRLWQLLVVIEYDCVFTEPKELLES